MVEWIFRSYLTQIDTLILEDSLTATTEVPQMSCKRRCTLSGVFERRVIPSSASAWHRSEERNRPLDVINTSLRVSSPSHIQERISYRVSIFGKPIPSSGIVSAQRFIFGIAWLSSYNHQQAFWLAVPPHRVAPLCDSSARTSPLLYCHTVISTLFLVSCVMIF